jgi:O-succinylbenzoic acid--CoA ligase
MPIPLKLVAANDTVGALLALADALAGKQAVFITAPETNGLMPEVHGLPNEVDQDVALIVESSGSTGTPKRISLSAAALVASAKASEARLAPDAAVNTQSQWLVCLPINYVAGANVLIRSLVADTQPVLMNTTLPFTADAFARSASLMTAERRFVSLVPTQLLRLVNQAGIDDFLLAGLKRFDSILLG